ncbi:MAG: RNase adapter RapZ [Arenibacterium sp.]
MPEIPSKAALVLVTGPSGAGRSTAINVLEDLGFESIDNMPINLVPRLLDGAALERPMALGIDARNRDFSTSGLIGTISELGARPEFDLTVLYLDCRAEILLRRFSETRRRHPLAPAEDPEAGVMRELDLLVDIREHADTLIDTSDLNVHELRAEIERLFAPSQKGRLSVTLQSFSYKRGLPRATDLVFDCRFLNNPYWQPDLRAGDGRDKAVASFIAKDRKFQPFFQRVHDLVQFLLPAYAEEGKSHLSIAFGCTGGQHRSVMMVETLAKALAEEGQQVSIRHRELRGRRMEERKA